MNTSNLKLGVDVVSAHNLLPKDGQGSSNAFVELYFDGQMLCTTIKENNLNPVWNESFYFNISDPSSLHILALEAYVYNTIRSTQSRLFLGKVTISGTSFVPCSDAVVLHYPLEKCSVFSRVRGELGLKVYVTNDPSIKSCIPISADNNTQVHSQSVQSPSPEVSHVKSEARHTYHHEPPPIPIPHRDWEKKYEVDEMKVAEPVDYALKETSPFLGGEQVVGCTYDLVEKIYFLFVRVVKARELPAMDVTGSLDPLVEARVGNYKGITNHVEKQQNPHWNVVFALSRERMQASVLEVVVKDKDLVKDDFVGLVRFDINEVPMRVPPDSPLAPEWYCLEDRKGVKIQGELMLAVWIGTQADEAFPDAWHAWHSDAALSINTAASTHICSKVYHAPRLWYVRVNVVEAQDLFPTEKNRFHHAFVKAQIGNQVMKTEPVQYQSFNPLWNEDLFFVAAEPFEDHLVLTVEDCVAPGKDKILGRVIIPLSEVERRADDRTIHSRWFDLEKPVAVDVDQVKKEKFSSRLHLRLCLDGGYHVFDESPYYSSDLRPSAKQLWQPPIGILELGILSAIDLHPMKIRDGKGSSDTYCVAKYGHKWVRTRTVVDNLCPKYNEQYTWEVFDADTVLTVGVFDNSQLGDKVPIGNKDLKIGKVRIRISTLETGRVYRHSYPLLVLHPTGVKQMGVLHLAIRFTCTSFANMLHIYSHPLLPKMHYVRPFPELDVLRHRAVNIVAMQLGRAEPPLRKEVVEYMSDVDSHRWSFRRTKANFFRLMSILSRFIAVGKWFGDICWWRNPIRTVIVHIVFLMHVLFPKLISLTVFFYIFYIGVWNYRYRPRYPPHIEKEVDPDELDEEFDTFPTSRNPEVVRIRYDRLRSLLGRIQLVVADTASQGERFQLLLSWRDHCATAIFVSFCLVVALVLYVTPFRIIAALIGIYTMRHPRFRNRRSSVPINFFRRLPYRTVNML